MCLNMILWERLCFSLAKMAMNSHITKSHRYAVSSHPYETQSGGSEADLYHYTSTTGITRVESELGYMSEPATGEGASKGWWLENPNDNVRAYGHGAPFGKRFQVIEKAVENDIGTLLGRLVRIYGPGIGVGTFGGNVGLR